MKTKWSAKWIWCVQNGIYDYNQTVLFRKEFELKKVVPATLRITADSWYRVSINGKWVHDGPGRAYPDHFQFDVHEVGSLLKKGKNKIEVIVRYFGIGTFHQMPLQAGLFAQLDAGETCIGTDTSWIASPSAAWQQWVPKISIQMEPVEEYDARLENVFDWQPAVEVKRAGRISPREVALLTKKPRAFKTLHSAFVVKRADPQFTVPVTQIAHPGIIEANGTTTRPVILGSVFAVRKKQQFNFNLERKKDDFANPGAKNWMIAVDGRILKSGMATLSPGAHQILFICTSFLGHEKDLAFPYLNMTGGQWGAWKVAVLDEFLFRSNDRIWFSFKNDAAEKVKTAYLKKIEQLAAACKTESKFNELLSGSFRDLPAEQIFMEDPVAEFASREPLSSADRLFGGTLVKPSVKGDVELCFDLGEQCCGYFEFNIKADEGVIVDLNAIEYIRADGVLQHVQAYNRNGLRYITKQGVNRFTSLKRRSGQYLFVTLRNQKTPVEIKSLRIIESTAPVEASGSFACNDPMLNKVWKISERTLQLCMEDTFTDCPLYEQTLWIGDARNEALYAFTAYANFDVSARSLEIGAQSLEHFPIVGCQVPSSWDCILPAWSFLWGMHVWEHYFYSGDLRFLRKIWPAVQQNIDGAFGLLDKNGLFSGTFWNLIEWAPIDESHATVLHNNMLLVGALRAAEKCAEALKDGPALKTLSTRRKKLVSAINKTWSDAKSSYPDSIHEDGKPSPKTCQQTAMLSVMCDVVPKNKKEAVRANLLNPPKEMTTVGAPFAMQFMYEALEELGEPDAILASIRAGFQPMVDAGASTVWETFAGSTCSPKGFPTRSHCHAWSSSPIYFLNRIVLGIRQTAIGGKAFEISPWLGGLRYARGTTATPAGLVSVEWKIDGKTLQVVISAPKGVKTEFKSNASHKGLAVDVVRR
ncbi:MAG: alpha-L-rhamnosidase N-terminal domain-containing protein [Kiritimatiellales bacterium]|nr:alpha-L-rhamnosidase N-terminal domain-containing protein [Kiritimatiellales bacterium]